MSEQNQEKMIPKQIAAKSLGLEGYILSVGRNYLQSDEARFKYGSIATSRENIIDITQKILNSDSAKQTREKLDKSKKDLAQQTGYNGEVPYTTDPEVLQNMYVATRENLQRVALGDLEKIIKDNGGEVREVPEKLKSLSQEDFVKYIQENKLIDKEGNLKQSKIKDKEYLAIGSWLSYLTKNYDLSCGLKLMKGIDHYKELNQIGDSLLQQYSELVGEDKNKAA